MGVRVDLYFGPFGRGRLYGDSRVRRRSSIRGSLFVGPPGRGPSVYGLDRITDTWVMGLVSLSTHLGWDRLGEVRSVCPY